LRSVGGPNWADAVNDLHPGWTHQLARFMTRSRLMDSGEATELYVPAGADVTGVAWLLLDWLDGYEVEVHPPNLIRVIKP
jgi:hypothetical protein